MNLTAVHTTLKTQYEKCISELEERSQKLAATNKQLDARRCVTVRDHTICVMYMRW